MLGLGGDGQLGNGATSDKTTPTLTSSLGTGRTAVALSSGYSHTCAILDNGAVSCWGDGAYGQLGNGGTSDKTTPTLTSSLGTGRTALLIDGDKDGDGVSDHFDSYLGDSIRSIKCDAGQFGRYQCVDAPLGKFVPSSGSMYATDASRRSSCHLLVRRVRLHAVLVTIKHHLVKHPAMQLMQATMFLAQPKRARPLVR